MSTIWENTDGFAEQHFCETALYLLSLLAHAYNIIFDCGVGAPVNSREVVDGLNCIRKQTFNVNDNSSTVWCIII